MTTLRRTLSRALAIAALLTVAAPAVVTQPARAQHERHDAVREIEIIVKAGYQPDRITIREGERVRLRFVRHEEGGCTREVVFPALKIRRELPPHTTVVIDLPALKAGEYEFHCGMEMIRGAVIVRQKA